MSFLCKDKDVFSMFSASRSNILDKPDIKPLSVTEHEMHAEITSHSKLPADPNAWIVKRCV